ncbi:3-dehydroquinate synthase [Sporolactobacillus shoreicorticis]|uniref:3-dehydroquinate synthase n=1 Tax=Sporolactobacillus shoreicorticis TaxID=1923877 RepID=A0ABW5S5P1_9BACL|nr:3-dehydroquinate synthase [Sporolactobacillus shoreicorticis]MCO7126319.1 3-dehydroquinate synthase [Sporolactobacillus shoreicorticis]
MKISVALPHKKYPIFIERGILDQLGLLLTGIWSPRKIALISDTHVAPLYQERIIRQLQTAGFRVVAFQVPAGESSKNWEIAVRLYRSLANNQFTRSDGVLALGGGVIGDLAGFVASTYMRGIAFIQIPTSLLAQVDSSVGGKTAINLDTAKNIIGTFYQPDAVFIDPDTLKSLPQRFICEGYAEIIKMSALEGGTFWQMTGEIHHPDEIITHVEPLIHQSISYKAKVVCRDEKEAGLRQILNFGHTIGHAIELLSNGALAHGEAISIGMVQIVQLFEAYDLTKDSISDGLMQRLNQAELPLNSPLIGTADFYRQIINDKKNHGGMLNLIYLKAPGRPAMHSIPIDRAKLFFTGKKSFETE